MATITVEELEDALLGLRRQVDEVRQLLFRSGPYSVGHAFEHGVDAHVPRNRLDATAAPGVGDDSGDGYGIGSLLLDVINSKAYICLASPAGAAVWKEITVQSSTPDTFTLVVMEDGVEVTMATLGWVYVEESDVAVGNVAGTPGTIYVKEAGVAVGDTAAPASIIVKEGGVLVGSTP